MPGNGKQHHTPKENLQESMSMIWHPASQCCNDTTHGNLSIDRWWYLHARRAFIQPGLPIIREVPNP